MWELFAQPKVIVRWLVLEVHEQTIIYGNVIYEICLDLELRCIIEMESKLVFTVFAIGEFSVNYYCTVTCMGSNLLDDLLGAKVLWLVSYGIEGVSMSLDTALGLGQPNKVRPTGFNDGSASKHNLYVCDDGLGILLNLQINLQFSQLADLFDYVVDAVR